MRALGVIPARMAASRFPGKPLARICGQPMLWHVWQRCQLSGAFDEVVIATCDDEIRAAAEAFGARVEMTSAAHTRANDRVAEVAARISADVVVNIQGDEPLVSPTLIREVVEGFERDPGILCLCPVAEIHEPIDLSSANTVKAVFDCRGRILCFSRLPIPSDAVARRIVPVYRQVPILGFQPRFLCDLAAMPETPLERQEQVDLLRALEYGFPVQALVTKFQTVGVDEPADVPRVERLLGADEVHAQYSRS